MCALTYNYIILLKSLIDYIFREHTHTHVCCCGCCCCCCYFRISWFSLYLCDLIYYCNCCCCNWVNVARTRLMTLQQFVSNWNSQLHIQGSLILILSRITHTYACASVCVYVCVGILSATLKQAQCANLHSGTHTYNIYVHAYVCTYVYSARTCKHKLETHTHIHICTLNKRNIF